MQSGDAEQAREAVMIYQRKGDLTGALALLEESGWERAEAVDVLRQSDLTAARATAILAIILLVIGAVAWVNRPDAWWLLMTLLAWGVERAFRAVKLVRRANELARS